MRRRLLAFAPALITVLTVSACGDGAARAPFADSQTPPSLGSRFYPPQGWSWGYVRSGEGRVQRYGVASPPVAPRAAILILTGYGESAEKWFETVSDLNAQGFTVWILERQGQGGSERATPWRDLGHVDAFAPDVAATRALVNGVIRPRPDTPLVVLGHSEGGLVALRAAQAGLAMDGLVLSSPALGLEALPRPRSDFARFTPAMRTLRLGWIRTPDQPDGAATGLTASSRASPTTRGAARCRPRGCWPIPTCAWAVGAWAGSPPSSTPRRQPRAKSALRPRRP